MWRGKHATYRIQSVDVSSRIDLPRPALIEPFTFAPFAPLV